jgi:hypothetical protein
MARAVEAGVEGLSAEEVRRPTAICGVLAEWFAP